MASPPKTPLERNTDYPTTDGKPMAETDLHRYLMFYLITALDLFYTDDPLAYVSGNLLMFYVPGDRRRHVSPDTFVVKGVPKRRRLNYLVWQEGRGPNVVFELTSSSTRKVDTGRKFVLYRDTLKVPEYILFDPYGDYLKPALQGYRLVGGDYVRIELVNGRLPSEQLGLHVEQVGSELRLWNPQTGTCLPTLEEQVLARQQAEAGRQAEAQARQHAEEEIRRLRKELEALRRQAGNQPG